MCEIASWHFLQGEGTTSSNLKHRLHVCLALVRGDRKVHADYSPALALLREGWSLSEGK